MATDLCAVGISLLIFTLMTATLCLELGALEIAHCQVPTMPAGIVATLPAPAAAAAVVLPVVLTWLMLAHSSRFIGGWASVWGKSVSVPSLPGKVYIVTGGSRGLGKQLVGRPAHARRTQLTTEEAEESQAVGGPVVPNTPEKRLRALSPRRKVTSHAARARRLVVC
jgi:hypothetical protein